MRRVPSIKTYIGNSRLAIEAIIVRRKERHAASGKNASGSFGIRKCVWSSGLLAEATLQSLVERSRAKPIQARMCRVPSILKLVWRTLDSRLKLQYNCPKKRGERSRCGLECIELHRY